MKENKVPGFLNIFVLIFSTLALVALLLETFIPLSSETIILLNHFDTGICFFFLFEFLYRFISAKNKLQYLKWGWIDLLASIPNTEYLRLGRIVRIIRIIRIFKAYNSLKEFTRYVFQDRAKAALYSTLLLSFFLVMAASISVLQFETDPQSNIKSSEDALWWSCTTVTTVGYGDRFPVTTGGRIIGVVLMVFGIGIFSTLAASITSILNTPKHQE
jgi:voltage-gated potassium channel